MAGLILGSTANPPRCSLLGVVSFIPTRAVEPCNSPESRGISNSLAVLRIFQFYASDWIYCSMFHAMIVIDISTSRKREAVYSQYCLQRLQIAFAEAVRPEPPGGWSRPPEDIDDGRERDAEGLIDGSLCRVPESNRNAGEEDDVLDLDVIDPDVLDSTVQYDLG